MTHSLIIEANLGKTGEIIKMEKALGNYTYSEICSQGVIWKKTLDGLTVQIPKLADWFKKDHDEVLFIGCGSTYYLSLAAAKTWINFKNEPARALPSSEMWLYPESVFTKKKPLLVAISRSGETTETINAIHAFRKHAEESQLVIGCYPESTMVKNSQFSLLAPDAQEVSIAQTRSFSSMFIISQYLSALAANQTDYLNQIRTLPDKFSSLLENSESHVKDITSEKRFQHFVFLGSGINYGIASEAMLKMKEMSMSVSEVFHFMEFRHGPMSVVTNKSLIIGLISDSQKEEELKVLRDMKALGATTMALIENSSGGEADHTFELNSGITQELRGALFLPILQLLSFYTATSKGLNPDKPTNLSSVVRL